MPRVLSFEEAVRLLKKYKIVFAKGIIARTEKQVVTACRNIGFPVVLKVLSSSVLHKTEAKAVAVDVRNEKEALQKYCKLIENVKKADRKAKIEGVLVQEFLKGIEVIIGGKKDEQFGQTVLFGTGGVMTELYNDKSIRVLPIEEKEALEMMQEVKGFKLLQGFRGEKPANLQAVQEMILKVNELLLNERISELDLNPVIVNESQALVVDVRILK